MPRYAMDEEYDKIEDYGVVGNLITTAHISKKGSVDWLCFPRINSPSVFARLLDSEKGGYLFLRPTGKFDSIQSYIPDTNILETVFKTATGVIKLTDFMYPFDNSSGDGKPFYSLFRKISGIEGTVDCTVSFFPRMDYAREIPRIEILKSGVKAAGKDNFLFLQTSIQCRIYQNMVRGDIRYNQGDENWIVLSYNEDRVFSGPQCVSFLTETENFWKDWVKSRKPSDYKYGRWDNLILRSGLALKMLINGQTGAIIAAPTTSLPEQLGGVRNWDYRFAWVRDGVFTIQALFHLGLHQELDKFRQWIDSIISGLKKPGELQPVYGIFPEDSLKEFNLDHFSGYMDSRPVRIGNLAADQLQLDIVGELVNVLYEGFQYGYPIHKEKWKLIHGLIDHLCEIWMKKDAGIWEVRGEPRHFVYSKVMCWVAFDRAIKIAEKFKLDMPGQRWVDARDKVRQKVLDEGFSKKINSFRRAFDADTVDATGLLIGIVKFLPHTDPRILGTIDRIVKELSVNNCLLYRYKEDDGLPGRDNPFLPCSFWLVKALALSGQVDKAKELFARISDYINPLGLLPEEISGKNGAYIGNYPQAFSHLGLINSALYIAAVTQGTKLNLAGMEDTREYGW